MDITKQVHQFPYALKALPAVLQSKWDDEDFKPYKDAFPQEAQESPEALQAHVENLTKRDVKIASLKNLQGYLWETGYKTGAYATSLFPDVTPRLKQWKEGGLDLAIYSSGSVFAQKLLFAHVKRDTAAAGQKRARANDNGDSKEADPEPPTKKIATSSNGEVPAADPGKTSAVPIEHKTKGDAKGPSIDIEDLQYLISDWFDTTNAGSKIETSSYHKIAQSLKVS